MKTLNLIILALIFSIQLLAQLKDIDGNSYEIIKIGKQEWMSKNLNSSHFRNGDTIPEAKTNIEWENSMEKKQPAWCHIYDIDPNGLKIGKLYNIYAVCDPRGLAPEGYRIPTVKDWELLYTTISWKYNNHAGNKLKSTYGWQNYSGTTNGKYNLVDGGNGTNEYGFNALPNSDRRFDGRYSHEELHPAGYMARWWCSSSCISNYYDLGLNRPFSQVTLNAGGGFIGSEYTNDYGVAVRCLKD
jgi:uncharacterized protein (TIGR02145 family)